MIEYRLGTDADRAGIVAAVSTAFYDQFKALSSDKNKLIEGLSHAVVPDRFVIAIEDGQVVGVVAIAFAGRSWLRFPAPSMGTSAGACWTARYALL